MSLHPPILPPNGCLLHCWQVLIKELVASFKDKNEPVKDFKVRPPAAGYNSAELLTGSHMRGFGPLGAGCAALPPPPRPLPERTS